MLALFNMPQTEVFILKFREWGHTRVCENMCKTLIEESMQIENALRTYAVPPIKGEITKGKIRWRGIRLVEFPPTMEHTDNGWVCKFDYQLRHRTHRIHSNGNRTIGKD